MMVELDARRFWREVTLRVMSFYSEKLFESNYE